MEIQSANIESFSMTEMIVSANDGPFGKKMAHNRGKAAAIDIQKRNLRKLSIPVFINQL